MATTARDLITAALRDLGAIGARQGATPNDLADGLIALNEWVSSLGTQRSSIFEVRREVYSLTANVASYTIGPGGAFNTVRPARIDHVGLIRDRAATPAIEVSLGAPMTDQEYRHVGNKAMTASHPAAVYYDHAFTGAGLGRLYPLPIPTTSAVDLALYIPRPMQEFANLSTLYAFPPGYQRAVRACLAIELAPMFEREPSAALVQRAQEAMTVIRRANRRSRTLVLDGGVLTTSGAYNIWTDT